ncbi:DUF3244 domain-containing protein [Bacteroides intestinalis]|uniref:DUF3244 domain-containing protein n=1 Tax=Bacteroides intestinalis TaxID=329854 RepID=A0A414LLU3_9BACE|nr:DUF3244 domain-containing protein [Bacteroides intestinalis]RHE95581.1 DUF3244 domain-containing protein [Bacteroides intestinalis]
MKLKLILCLLGLFLLLRVNAGSPGGNDRGLEQVLIQMTGNDVPFDILTKGNLGDHRSVRPFIPIHVMLDGSSYSLEVCFEQAIGEVDITISQNGVVVYSSSEDVQASMQKIIQLNSGASGNFLIEIEGKNGAYACGQFEL